MPVIEPWQFPLFGASKLVAHPWMPKGKIWRHPFEANTFLTDPETFRRIEEKGLDGVYDEEFLKAVGIKSDDEVGDR